jgi:hypothetical protein
MQKTWIDLLGTDTSKCRVDENMIVRETSPGQFKVLWTAETHEAATRILDHWKQEVAKQMVNPPEDYELEARRHEAGKHF